VLNVLVHTVTIQPQMALLFKLNFSYKFISIACLFEQRKYNYSFWSFINVIIEDERIFQKELEPV
jgi:hypothetical protein